MNFAFSGLLFNKKSTPCAMSVKLKIEASFHLSQTYTCVTVGLNHALRNISVGILKDWPVLLKTQF